MATSVIRRLWVDLDDMTVSASLGDRNPIGSLRLKARDSARIGFQFHRSGVPELLAAGSAITFGIKADGDFGGAYLASVTSFTAATTIKTVDFTDSDFYYGQLDLNTSTITTALGSSQRSLGGMAELEIDVSGAGYRQSTEAIDTIIANDVNQGGEGTPSSADPPYPSASEVFRWKPGITSLIGGGASDLDSVPATGITPPYAIAINNQDVSATNWEFWILETGTEAEDVGSGIVRPDDFAVTTNEKVWKRKTLFPAVDDDSVSAAASATNYTPGASTVAGHLSGIDSALGTIGSAISNVVEDTTPQSGGNFDFNGFNADFDDATGIRDDSGNEQVIFQKTASAVNYLEVTNAATGTAPTLSATGSDTDVSLLLEAKGAGTIDLGADLNTDGNHIIFNDGGSIHDTSGNELLRFDSASSAVNCVEVGNSGTGVGVDITAAGSDTNISLLLVSKGTGTVQANGARVITAAGVSGGQTIIGGTASANALTLRSTSHSTPGGVALYAGDWLDVPEIAAPGTPTSGFGRLYVSTSGVLSFKDDAGAVTAIQGGGQWRNQMVSATTMRPATTAGCAALANFETTTYDRNWGVLAFDDSAIEAAWGTLLLPNDWDDSTSIKAKIHYYAANTGVVRWSIGGVSFGAEDTADSVSGTGFAINHTGAGSARYRITAATSAISFTNAAAGENVAFVVTRIGSDGADTLTGDAMLIGVEFQLYTTGNAAAW